jgi:hypothetical protein
MPTRRKQWILWLLLALIVVGAGGFLALLTVPAPIESCLQDRILLAIPTLYVTADNFVLPNRRDGGLPPFITVKHVTVKARFFELLRSPIHVRWVKLQTEMEEDLLGRPRLLHSILCPPLPFPTTS